MPHMVEQARAWCHYQRVPLAARLSSLTIILAAMVIVQRDEDGVLAEHKSLWEGGTKTCNGGHARGSSSISLPQREEANPGSPKARKSPDVLTRFGGRRAS